MDQLDLNCDVGETFLENAIDIESQLMPLVSSCNISCGAHSGTPESIEATIQLAMAHAVAIGAHPSYPDREHGGRVSMQISVDALCNSVHSQIVSLREIVHKFGGVLRHVKPHGALYHDLTHKTELANAFFQMLTDVDPRLKCYGLAGAPSADLAKAASVTYIHEAFADRRYEAAGQLCDRSRVDACLDSPQDAVSQTQRFLRQQVVDVHGCAHHLSVDSICVHSDTKNAIVLVKAIRNFLAEKKIEIAHPQRPHS